MRGSEREYPYSQINSITSSQQTKSNDKIKTIMQYLSWQSHNLVRLLIFCQIFFLRNALSTNQFRSICFVFNTQLTVELLYPTFLSGEFEIFFILPTYALNYDFLWSYQLFLGLRLDDWFFVLFFFILAKENGLSRKLLMLFVLFWASVNIFLLEFWLFFVFLHLLFCFFGLPLAFEKSTIYLAYIYMVFDSKFLSPNINLSIYAVILPFQGVRDERTLPVSSQPWYMLQAVDQKLIVLPSLSISLKKDPLRGQPSNYPSSFGWPSAQTSS